jgi:hypothetical protein
MRPEIFSELRKVRNHIAHGLKLTGRFSRIVVLRLQLLHSRLVRLNLRLKRGLLKAVKQIAIFDLGALDEEPLLEERADPGNERPSHRLDPADELVSLGYLLALGAHHPDRRWPMGRWLSVGPGRKRGGEKGQ